MRWRERYSLSTQFLVAAAIVLGLSSAVLGTWVSHQITRSVLATSGADGAAFMRGMLQRHVQRMLADGSLHPEDVAALDRLFVGTELGESIVSVKIWTAGGSADSTILYSSLASDVVGDRFVSTDVQEAASGQVVAEFEDMVSAESLHEQQLDMPLIEVYSPLYRAGTDQVIAVGEIYENAVILAQQLRQSVVRTWLIVCATSFGTMTILYLIVRRGSRLIRTQQAELNLKVREAEQMAAENHDLSLEADRSRLDANEANEELLGRIGLDIHDGPIQLLTLARLRLDDVTEALGAARGEAPPGELSELGGKLSQVIDELRDLSVGLVLPELGSLSPLEAIELAVQRHEQLTGTEVGFRADALPESLPDSLKICLYRIVQESLSNAFKHAGGIGQRVDASAKGGRLRLVISDAGSPDAGSAARHGPGPKLGQRGIKNRVAAFGGALSIERTAEGGTRVSVSMPLTAQARTAAHAAG
jgi:signal transduction histidine kinase